jgi:hypothetical protein
MAMILLFSVSCSDREYERSEKREQVIHLPNHYTYDEIAAISFPGRNVQFFNVSPDDEVVLRKAPFHVICMAVGSGLECVSTLEERGLYIAYATLSEECFEVPSRDDRFVIANPIRQNACVLNATLSTTRGHIETIVDNEHLDDVPHVSPWSVDASVVQIRVNAYNAVVDAMKRNHLDFTNQILRKEDISLKCLGDMTKLLYKSTYLPFKSFIPHGSLLFPSLDELEENNPWVVPPLPIRFMQALIRNIHRQAMHVFANSDKVYQDTAFAFNQIIAFINPFLNAIDPVIPFFKAALQLLIRAPLVFFAILVFAVFVMFFMIALLKNIISSVLFWVTLLIPLFLTGFIFIAFIGILFYPLLIQFIK